MECIETEEKGSAVVDRTPGYCLKAGTDTAGCPGLYLFEF